jgi:hypothetical protein
MGIFNDLYDDAALSLVPIDVCPTAGYDAFMAIVSSYAGVFPKKGDDATKTRLIVFYFHQAESRKQGRLVRCLINGSSKNLPQILSDPNLMICVCKTTQ